MARRLIPLGLAITAFVVATLAVVPFLYAALLLEMAVLFPFPSSHAGRNRKGINPLLDFHVSRAVYSLLRMVADRLSKPIRVTGSLYNKRQSLGFGLPSCSHFPFLYLDSMLTEESHPYAVGFHPVDASHCNDVFSVSGF